MAADPPHVAELESFLAERGEPLLRAAIVMAGDRESGEDLLQASVERLLRNWRKIRDDPESYLRRTLYHLAIDGWRRQGNWRAKLGLLRASGEPNAVDGTLVIDQRDQLTRLLGQLPPRQRAAIVLRYLEDLSDTESAQVMGCSVATVRSAISRGLGRLRELDDEYDPVSRRKA